MEYYHIDPIGLIIICGPFSLVPGKTSYPTYCKKLCCCGNPGDLPAEMLLMHGLVPLVSAELLPNQKYGDPVVYADRVERAAVDLTAGELAPQLAAKVNAKYQEIVAAYQADTAPLFAGFTPEHKETFWLQVKEAEGFTSDSNHPTPFIDGRVSGEQISKAEVVALILGEAAAMKPYAGAIYGKQKRLEKALTDIDINGNYAAGCAAVAAINW
jgi:hypothetical protein